MPADQFRPETRDPQQVAEANQTASDGLRKIPLVIGGVVVNSEAPIAESRTPEREEGE